MLALAGCGASVDFDSRDCTQTELAFIDVATDRATAVEHLVGPELAERYPSESVTFGDVLARLGEARRDEKIRCGRVAEGEPQVFGLADVVSGTIILNMESRRWTAPLEAHTLSEGYGQLTTEEIAAQIESADWDAFHELKEMGRGHLYAPGIVSMSLVHEAAHLVTGSDYPHDEENAEQVRAEGDFVTEAGELTLDAIYWDIWLPERQWMDELYFQ